LFHSDSLVSHAMPASFRDFLKSVDADGTPEAVIVEAEAALKHVLRIEKQSSLDGVTGEDIDATYKGESIDVAVKAFLKRAASVATHAGAAKRLRAGNAFAAAASTGDASPSLQQPDTTPGMDQCPAYGLMRASHHPFDFGELKLRVSLAPPLAGGVPDSVLYVMDAEPELFALSALHLYSRTGYCVDQDSPMYSPLRHLAVVGVGHDPACISMSKCGWDIASFRALRQRDYWKDCSKLLTVLCENVVPWAEQQLGAVELPAACRAILGCSLSGGFSLRTLFMRPGLFGKIILGSPSLHLMPDMFELAECRAADYLTKEVRTVTSVLFISTQHETQEPNPPGNGIPAAARLMAARLKEKGIQTTDVYLLEDEAHDSMKPSLTTRGLGWLEEQLCGRRVFS